MNEFFKYCVLGIISYFVLWTLTYLIIMGPEYKYFIEYFKLAWTNPGEVPAFLQMVALIGTLILIISVFLFKFFVKKYQYKAK